MTDTYSSAEALLVHTAPVDPVVCLRPQLIAARARRMLAAFPGDMLYAVKCNEAPGVVRALWDGGVRAFDTASIGEVRAVKALLPAAVCHFMHPIKSPEAIAEAYHRHGVRRFVLDHPDELAKIVAHTGGGGDLELFVRLAVPGEGSMLALTGKFGVGVDETAALVRAARPHARSVGITFHVGSQCVEPVAFARAISLVAEVVRRAGPIDDLDVGGGFPARYLGDEPEFEAFVAAIRDAVARHGLGCRLQCEPGRALVADGASVLARVELRRGLGLYLNDGTYGNLAELKWIGPQFPMRLVRPERASDSRQLGFDLFGPTCDSIDSMPGPHWLPADTKAGDWIEVGMMGAYANSLRTRFNGFTSAPMALLGDSGWVGADREQRVRIGMRAMAA
ncbi:MAG: type III PLP-dependent enzyme [Geminicoccaceae bacterium]